MRSILEHCVEMDMLAADTYARMAERCPDSQIAGAFRALAAEEATHVEWWRELLAAWDAGLVPDVINDTVGLEGHIEALHDELSSAIPGDVSSLSAEQMLATAARMEFFMLDASFAELLDLTEPGGMRRRRQEYARHVERVVELIEVGSPGDALAGFLARVLKRAWGDNLKLAAYASRDVLTGLLNRRGLTNQARQWTAWAARYGRPLAVLLVDVDDLGHINDTHGHAAGDRALRAVAAALTDAVRASDLVARYGGDEFAVLAPETDMVVLGSLVERILGRMRDVTVDAPGASEPLRITVSVGGAVTTASQLLSSESTPEDLFAAADRSLYDAKRGGKDRGGELYLASAHGVAS